MLADVDAALKASAAIWFRARTCHEYGTVLQTVGHRVDFENAAILDFGCGDLPVAAASFALRHPTARVRGCDILAANLEAVRNALAEQANLPFPSNLVLDRMEPNILPADCVGMDLTYSWSVFEHIPARDVTRNFELVRQSLGPSGVFFFQIGGLYFHTEGSHLKHLFPDEPWHHLTYSLAELEQRVFATPHPEASKQSNWSQFMELNRLTCEDFLDAASDAGLELLSQSKILDTSIPIPPKLLRAYSEEALKTSEIRAVFKPRSRS